MGGLTGVAVVTGAAKGIGAAIVRALAEGGATVALLDLEDAGALAEEVGGRAWVCDVSDKAAVETVMADVAETLGPVRLLVANAGIVTGPGQPFTLNDEADWDRAFAVNVKGVVHSAGAVEAGMRAAGDGRIVVVSSITGLIAAPFMPPYSVSKAAVNGLVRVLARQLAPDGITVNAVCPGFVWSPLWEDLGAEMAVTSGGAHADAQAVFDSRIEQLVPMGRPQAPEEVAALVAFLCSDAARNITGQLIAVDGGVSI